MTDTFEIGQRVWVSDPHSLYEGAGGIVAAGNYAAHVAVRMFDLGSDGVLRYFWPWQLTGIEQAPASPPKPECYITAWAYCGTSFSMTGDEPFTTKEGADASAKLLANEHPGGDVAVFKLVSKHSSSVTVTSEDV